ncbi:MAG: flavin reductase family protein [Pseudomonadota bacterium]
MTVVLQQGYTEKTPTPIDSSLFRRVMGQFPTGVAIVTVERPGAPYLGVTINSLISVSLAPPLILFCAKKTAQAYDIIASASAFSVSILADNQESLALQCAKPGGMELDTALVTGSAAGTECIQEAMHSGGDHTIIVGRVKALHFDSDRQPLVFHRSRFATVTKEKFAEI